MQKWTLAALLVIVLTASACSKAAVQPEQPKPTAAGTAAPVAASCDSPPEVLQFSGKSYHLKEKTATSEPGMKLGYMKCDKGSFTPGDTDTYIVYSAGDPKTNSDIIFSGKWGLAQYSVAAK